MKVARRKLFAEVDQALSGETKKSLDPIWLLGAVILLREVTKEDAPFVAHLHETDEERHQRLRYGGGVP